MAISNFQMVTRLSMPKATEKLQPYSEFTSGDWAMPKLKFNALERDYSHLLEIDDVYKKDGTGTVTVFTPATYDESGKKTGNGDKVTIKWKDRLDKKNIDLSANYRKYVLDTEEPAVRNIRKAVIDKLKDKKPLTKDELDTLGVTTDKEAKDRIVESQKKHQEFLTGYDMMNAVKAMLESGEFNGKKFHITRTRINESWNPKNNQFYETLEPVAIYLTDDSADEYATMTVDFYYGKDCVEEDKENNRLLISGWVFNYVNNKSFKKNVFIPKTIVFTPNTTDKDKAKKQIEFMKKKFTVKDDKLKCVNVDLDMVDGSPRVAVTLKDLPEDIQDSVELGIMTEEEALRDHASGSYIRGERVRELRFTKPRGSFEDTEYTLADTELVQDDGDLFADSSETKDEQKADTKSVDATDDSDKEFEDLFGSNVA